MAHNSSFKRSRSRDDLFCSIEIQQVSDGGIRISKMLDILILSSCVWPIFEKKSSAAYKWNSESIELHKHFWILFIYFTERICCLSPKWELKAAYTILLIFILPTTLWDSLSWECASSSRYSWQSGVLKLGVPDPNPAL